MADEDQASLEKSGLVFNIHALIGGQLAGDAEHKLYMIYPQGNWVEIGEGTPYHIIGASGYGKPVLDRTLKYEDSLQFALKVGTLAFDSTRISAADVDFPGRHRAVRAQQFQDDLAAIRKERPAGEFRAVAGAAAQSVRELRSIGRSRCWIACPDSQVLPLQAKRASG